MTTLLLLLLYALVGAAAVLVARWLSRPPSWRYLLAFWLVPVVFIAPGLFTGKTILPTDHAKLILPWSATAGAVDRYNPNLNDIATHMAPWAKAVRMSWKEGTLPWRQRWNGSGMALAANAQSAAFSPLTFLMFALPLAHAFTFAAAVKLFLALLGAWLWLTELGVSRMSALFGAACFGLSGAMTPWILFPHTTVLCLFPWALFAMERLRDERVRRRAMAALAAILLCWALGGHPETAVLGVLFLLLWILGRAVWDDPARPAAALRRVLVCGALACGLSAFLLLPQALAIAESSRVPVAREFRDRLPVRAVPHGPLWRYGLVTAAFPRALGDAVDSPMLKEAVGSFPEMALSYFGVLGWAGALCIFRPGSRRKRAELALLVPLVAGLGASVGLWPFFEIAVLTPVLGMMFILRYLTWVPLAGAAIAAFELDRLAADSVGRRRSVWLFLASPAALAAFGIWTYQRFRPDHLASGGLDSQKAAFTIAWICLGAAAVLFLAVRLRPGPKSVAVFSTTLAAIAAAELLYQGMRLYRFGSPADLYPDTPMLAFLRSRPGTFRVAGEGTVLFPDSSIFAGLEDVRTKDPVERLDYIEFLDATCGYPAKEEFKQLRNVNCSALDFLNVRYLLSAPGRASPGEKWRPVYSGADGTVFENRDVLPRVFAPQKITLIAGSGKPAGLSWNAFTLFGAPARALSSKSEWKEQAFVLGGEGMLENIPVEISEYRESGNRISFRIHAEAGTSGAWIVGSLVQDGGWTARDENGLLVPATLANGPFLALRVPRGDHRIVLTYRPPGFPPGFLILLATVLVVSASAVGGTVRRTSKSRVVAAAAAPSARRPVSMPLLWLSAAVAALVAGLTASRLPWRAPLRVPATPLDYTNPRLAEMWHFLDEVRSHVPPDVSYTVRTTDRGEQMYLFMVSLGLLDRQLGLPSSYFEMSGPHGEWAKYVLVFGKPENLEGLRLVFQGEKGAVYERMSR
ncbi:MAG TPA: hypothetical protein VKG01_18045 [Thermoanaerobaculia bacterium]|nr:hypothetical protein [Thermoanaerobaculia bacterium]